MVEIPLPPDRRPSPAKVHDLEMLVFTPGGRERTLLEYRALLASAGLRLQRILRTGRRSRSSKPSGRRAAARVAAELPQRRPESILK